MGCRCAERGQQLMAATKAVIRGDGKAAADHLAKAAQSVKDDARDLRKMIANGRASLARR